MPTTVTTAEINACNQKFWGNQNILMQGRLADHAVASLAFEMMNVELDKRPGVLQRPYEEILEDAETAKKYLFAYQARKAGKAKKGDALNKWIFEVVSRNPQISEAQMLIALENNQKIPPIGDIMDGMIEYTNDDGSEGSAPISGLKDRLLRAKKQLKSR